MYLVGLSVDDFLEGPTQQVLTAFRHRDVVVGAQPDIAGSQQIGGDEDDQVAFEDGALVLNQAVWFLPQLDVALNVDYLRHPVTNAAYQVLSTAHLYLNGTSWPSHGQLAVFRCGAPHFMCGVKFNANGC